MENNSNTLKMAGFSVGLTVGLTKELFKYTYTDMIMYLKMS